MRPFLSLDLRAVREKPACHASLCSDVPGTTRLNNKSWNGAFDFGQPGVGPVWTRTGESPDLCLGVQAGLRNTTQSLPIRFSGGIPSSHRASTVERAVDGTASSSRYLGTCCVDCPGRGHCLHPSAELETTMDPSVDLPSEVRGHDLASDRWGGTSRGDHARRGSRLRRLRGLGRHEGSFAAWILITNGT